MYRADASPLATRKLPFSLLLDLSPLSRRESEGCHRSRRRRQPCSYNRRLCMGATAELHYRRLLFRTRLLGDRLYTPSHFWIQERERGVWRIGLTKFASRMLGDIVEIAFDRKAGDVVHIGD